MAPFYNATLPYLLIRHCVRELELRTHYSQVRGHELTESSQSQLLSLDQPAAEWISYLWTGNPTFLKTPSHSEQGLFLHFDGWTSILEALNVDLDRPRSLRRVPHDPTDWEDSLNELCSADTPPTAWLLPSVSTQDGFVLGHELSSHFAALLRSQRPEDYLLIEDSWGTMSWNRYEAPVQIRKLSQERTFWICNMKHLGLSETDSFWMRCPKPDEILPAPPQNKIQSSDLLLSMMFERDIHKSVSYLRRSVQAKRRFRVISDILQPFVKRSLIEVAHWPVSGLRIRARFCPRRTLERTEWMETIAKKHALKLGWQHEQMSFDICVARPRDDFQGLGPRLKNWLEECAAR